MIGKKFAGIKKHNAAIERASVLVNESGFRCGKGSSQMGHVDMFADEMFLQLRQSDTFAFLSVSIMKSLPYLSGVKTAA